MKILIAGYESAPFYKRGGLGDVMESLPKALNNIGIDIRVIIPYYSDIKERYHFKEEGRFKIVVGSKSITIGVYSSILPGARVPYYFLDNKEHHFISYKRGKDKINQFAVFSLAVIHFIHWIARHHRWTPDVIHCNDWHTALTPLILKHTDKISIPTLLTIHNLMYQGIGSLKVLDLLNIEDEETLELKRGNPAAKINILGEGIISATRVSTVSPSYAEEITQIEHKRNPISPFLIKRDREKTEKKQRIIGILNGIDYDIWNPKNDELIFHKYDISDWEIRKKDNKEDLLKLMKLENRPTFCFVGRMAMQKGLDLLIKTASKLEALGINIIIIGSGSSIIERKVLDLAKKYPWIKAEVIYSEDLARKIYAGSDFIIIPSRYEPCGLIQMIAMKYGTLPIASNTGGLHDTISNNENGFLFEKGKSLQLRKVIKHALNVYKDKERFRRMVEKAMKIDFSWDKSAVLYKKLYEEMIDKK